MPLHVSVLGGPRDDNALLVRALGGQSARRLLFDCGEGVLRGVARADVQDIDHLFFSHLHMDHVAGFDGFFRVNAARPRTVDVWGPAQTATLLHHRLRGVMWNLHAGLPGTWDVHDIHEDHVSGARFRLAEAFAARHELPRVEREDAVILRDDALSVEAYLLDHRTPSAAYVVRKTPRVNLDTDRLRELGLTPGPWVSRLKAGEEGTLEAQGRTFHLADLRGELLRTTPGESVAYLTDFLLDEEAHARLTSVLRGVDTVVCESQYRAHDHALAIANHHMTSVQAARLARDADVGRLVLFHVSERYDAADLPGLLAEARAVFPRVEFPPHWT
ncbi:MBL fold metallo-hydrolase [Deinococcus pimensis]|uniref:MBL fold metallo-hydrolase n=1 Tax=Deinococcus pimensis TaxID=309888 RepID=UPI00047F5EB4|nr:MBL fold metallo-hydrolase [Deinococcus pimensis]